jgi:hypothetical protein
MARVAPETELKELFERLGWAPPDRKLPEESMIQDDGLTVLSLFTPKSSYTDPSMEGIKLPSTLAKVTGVSAKAVRSKAAAIALETLAKYGVTTEWSYEIKRRHELSIIGLIDKEQLIMAKLKKMGFRDYLFKTSRSAGGATRGLVNLQLLGIADKKQILESAQVQYDQVNVEKARMLNSFLEKK